MKINDKLIPKYEVGDTFSAEYMILVGHLTGGSKAIYFNVILDKQLSDDVKTITCTNLTCVARSTLGYINNNGNNVNYATTSGYSLVCQKASKNTIRITINSSSAFTNATNNTVVDLGGDVTLNFS